ncbi:hypothetical protein, partial [Burkholderia vietnamiensis]|uniref:hypothetical protein n=1 Tax=Burkholderia vietnamiensis TaxID=60552 RepID=UPI003FF06E40
MAGSIDIGRPARDLAIAADRRAIRLDTGQRRRAEARLMQVNRIPRGGNTVGASSRAAMRERARRRHVRCVTAAAVR